MAGTMGRLAPMAHLLLVVGGLRKLEVARLIETMIPPNPAHVLSSGRGVEADSRKTLATSEDDAAVLVVPGTCLILLQDGKLNAVHSTDLVAGQVQSCIACPMPVLLTRESIGIDIAIE